MLHFALHKFKYTSLKCSIFSNFVCDFLSLVTNKRAAHVSIYTDFNLFTDAYLISAIYVDFYTDLCSPSSRWRSAACFLRPLASSDGFSVHRFAERVLCPYLIWFCTRRKKIEGPNQSIFRDSPIFDPSDDVGSDLPAFPAHPIISSWSEWFLQKRKMRQYTEITGKKRM